MSISLWVLVTGTDLIEAFEGIERSGIRDIIGGIGGGVGGGGRFLFVLVGSSICNDWSTRELVDLFFKIGLKVGIG
jgi:hypothetical protein